MLATKQKRKVYHMKWQSSIHTFLSRSAAHFPEVSFLFSEGQRSKNNCLPIASMKHGALGLSMKNFATSYSNYICVFSLWRELGFVISSVKMQNCVLGFVVLWPCNIHCPFVVSVSLPLLLLTSLLHSSSMESLCSWYHPPALWMSM